MKDLKWKKKKIKKKCRHIDQQRYSHELTHTQTPEHCFNNVWARGDSNSCRQLWTKGIPEYSEVFEPVCEPPSLPLLS